MAMQPQRQTELEAGILASRRSGPSTPPAAEVRGLNLQDLVISVEGDGTGLALFREDGREPLYRTRLAHATKLAPVFTGDGRSMFLASADGWITRFDLSSLTVVAEVRAGPDASQMAIAADGSHLAVTIDQPPALVLFDGDLNLLRVHGLRDKDGKLDSRASALRDAGPRRSFVLALAEVAEVWEVSYDPRAEDVPTGMVHDFQYREGAFIRGYLNPRRTFLPEPVRSFRFVSRDCSEILSLSRDTGKGHVVNLDVRRRIAEDDRPY